MGTIFVAYGDQDGREDVLAFATERAAASGDDLFVYHVEETGEESPENICAEIERIVERIAPDVAVDTHVAVPVHDSDLSNVSKQKRLLDAIFESDHEFQYVVMGNVKRGAVESLTISSMTKAVLESREIPVVLVPV